MSKSPGWIGTTVNVFRTARRWMFSKDDIHVEAAKGNLENLQALLQRNPGAVNLVDPMDNGTPLHWAAIYGQAEVCALLLDHGADITRVDERGHSPLFWAIAGNEPEVVELLLDHGADLTKRDNDGQTALEYALAKQQDETVALLRERGAQ
jgi:ankyrin repeat protein